MRERAQYSQRCGGGPKEAVNGRVQNRLDLPACVPVGDVNELGRCLKPPDAVAPASCIFCQQQGRDGVEVVVPLTEVRDFSSPGLRIRLVRCVGASQPLDLQLELAAPRQNSPIEMNS